MQVITTAGTSYERSSIQCWLDRQAAGGVCTDPKTGAKLDSTTLTPNQALRAAIAEWKEQQQQKLLGSDSAENQQKQMQQLEKFQNEYNVRKDTAALRQEQDAEYEAGLARDLMLAAAAKRQEEAAAATGSADEA